MQFNECIASVKKSSSVELMVKAQQLREQGCEVIGLAGGEPDFDTPQVIKDRAIQELLKGNTHYAVGKGIAKLRKRIREKLESENAICVNEEEIIVTPGAKYAIYLAVRTCINHGDEVMILNPAWVSYEQIVLASGGIPINVRLEPKNSYKITAEILEKNYTPKTKMLIINSPNNPTGRVLSHEEANEIQKFMLGKDIVIVSDEIYEKIIFDGKKHISLGAMKGLEKKTITVNGFSKGFAMTGWRIAYLAGDKKYIDSIYKLFSHTITGVSPFIQEAAAIAFECTDEIEWMQKLYQERRDNFIKKLNCIPGVSASVPEGAFYAWVKFDKDGMNSYEIAQFLLSEANVIGVPGTAYGLGGENYIRFSFACNNEMLDRATQRIASIM